MRKLGLAIAAVAMVGLFAGSAMAVKPATKGNDLPLVNMSDSWTLVIHARPFDKCPTADFKDTNRRSIVVAGLPPADFALAVIAHGNKVPDMSHFNDILLTSNDSMDFFQVLDGNACDGDPAVLEFPIEVATKYELFIKLLGKPDEKTAATVCARDLLGLIDGGAFAGELVCNVGTVKVRQHGNNPYENVTDELLFLFGVPLFDEDFEGWFWDWSATEKAKSRIVFVPVP